MTMIIAPPPEVPPTPVANTVVVRAGVTVTSSTATLLYRDPELDPLSADLGEEPMDYSPLAGNDLVLPGSPDEGWADDTSSPFGF